MFLWFTLQFCQYLRLYRHLPGGTEENNDDRQSGYSVFRPRFEPSTSRIQVQSVIAIHTSPDPILYKNITFFGPDKKM
jgi:hypothetical protein